MVTAALEVDRKGLARKLAGKPKSFIVYELLQNSLDENPSIIHITTEMVAGKPQCHIRVQDDDPDGFQDLRSIYTLFRDSKKGPNPEKRGRYELGEKLIIANALQMTVKTTKGTIIFEGDTRQETRDKTEKGTIVDLYVKMTREEYEQLQQDVQLFLPDPNGPIVVYNNSRMPAREKVGEFETILPTVFTDEEGNLKPTRRKTKVMAYPVREGEEAYLYEMGIPVLKIGDKWHLDVQQRVPLNWERDLVPPSFLKMLRSSVLNEMHEFLSKEDATQDWVQSVLEEADSPALETVLTHQFGSKRVISDPSDPEANDIAATQGYTIIPGGSFRKDVWANIKDRGVLQPAGQVTPSPKPYSDDPNAPLEKLLPENKWTDDIRRIVALTQRMGRELLGEEIHVRISLSTNTFAANFGSELFGEHFCFNLFRLGHVWFAQKNTSSKVLDLIYHEFAHHYASNHRSEEYHDALSDLAARGTILALTKPEVFDA